MQVVRSVRLSDEEVAALLNALDDRNEPTQDEHRSHERFSYRVKGCVIHMQQPGDAGRSAFLVPTRNLSAQGLAFLHGGFVHENTRVVVQLISRYGSWENVVATVLACRHVQGPIHEIRIRFDRTIDPGLFCADAVKVRVLLVEDDPSQVAIVKHMLTKLYATIDVACDGVQAVEKASSQIFDVLFMDMDMPVLDGFEATRQLRARGYTGHIIAMTGMSESEDRVRCLEAGCDQYVAKPIRLENIAGVLESFKKEPLISSLANDPSLTSLIDDFVAGLPKMLGSIEAAFAGEELERLESLARLVKGSSGTYGFEPISTAAAALEKAVHAGGDTEELQEAVASLAQWCRLARSQSDPENTAKTTS